MVTEITKWLPPHWWTKTNSQLQAGFLRQFCFGSQFQELSCEGARQQGTAGFGEALHVRNAVRFRTASSVRAHHDLPILDLAGPGFRAMRLSLIHRDARPILWITLLILPLAMYGSTKAVQLTRNRIIDWLPSNFEETRKLLWFNDHFGSDEILAISWPGCTLNNTAIDDLVESLQAPFQMPHGAVPLFHEVTSGRSMMDRLTSAPIQLNRGQARQRLEGWFLGPDNQTTCVIARISPNPDGSFPREQAVSFVRQTAIEQAAALGLNPGELKIAGPTADSAAINTASAANINRMRILALLLGTGLAWIGLRNVRQVTIVFATALLATLLTLASVYFCGQYMDAILLPLPALVFVLTVSGAIHLTQYYVVARKEQSHAEATASALTSGTLPCILASLTSMVGLASLAMSDVLPVRRFGLLAAMGIGWGLLCLLLVWPALTQRFGNRRRPGNLPERTGSNSACPNRWKALCTWCWKGHGVVLALTVLSIPLIAMGFSHLNTSVSLSSLLPASSPLLQSYDWFEEHIGPLIPVEIVLEFPRRPADDTRAILERAVIVESLRHRIAAIDATGGTFATTTMMPELPTAQGARQRMQQRVLGNKLQKRSNQLIQARMIAVDATCEYWRISTRSSSGLNDYGPFLESLHEVVGEFQEQSAAFGASPNNRFSTRICGSVPLIQKAQKQLLKDLVDSMLIAVGLITIMMMLLLGSVGAGILTMIPNVLPCLCVLAAIGWSGRLIDVGTMMTASVALGIAVDDTLHFLVAFRRATRRGANRVKALRHAFARCANAMVLTTFICGFGMLPFVYSAFGPVQRFAGGMISLLGAALIGDLLILPAILASPLGRFFTPVPEHAPPDSSHGNQQNQLVASTAATRPSEFLTHV